MSIADELQQIRRDGGRVTDLSSLPVGTLFYDINNGCQAEIIEYNHKKYMQCEKFTHSLNTTYLAAIDIIYLEQGTDEPFQFQIGDIIQCIFGPSIIVGLPQNLDPKFHIWNGQSIYDIRFADMQQCQYLGHMDYHKFIRPYVIA